MGLLIRDRKCPACGRGHTFSNPEPPAARGGKYEFVCPQTGRRAVVDGGLPAGEDARHAPQGAVQLAPARR